MDIITRDSPLAAAFFAPLGPLLQAARHRRACPELPDSAWVILGIHRVLEDQPGGRAFLQKAAASPAGAPARSSFFAALASPRRLLHAREINEALALRMAASLPDPFAAFPALKEFDLHAGDGHWHAAAAHDRRAATGTKHPTGHLYLLNLRSQAMRHLDVCDPVHKLKEHDLPILKRHPHSVLRGHAPKGRRVIIAWDRACLDFRFWQKAKEQSGLYIVTRSKSNTQLTRCGFNPFDKEDPVNWGVLSDESGAPAATGRILRRLTWQDPDTGESWEYLTNEMTLAPGLIVLLYRRRWDIEKCFDTFKNKLHEKKSWACSVTAKAAQANFLCLGHNLMVLYENHLAAARAITNGAEIKRRAGRLEKRTAAAGKAGRKIPSIICGVQRLTQCSVKFIRWLRHFLWRSHALEEIYPVLRKLYATL